jgi:hypothetical protein
LAEDEARQSRRPTLPTDATSGGDWARQARREALR